MIPIKNLRGKAVFCSVSIRYGASFVNSSEGRMLKFLCLKKDEKRSGPPASMQRCRTSNSINWIRCMRTHPPFRRRLCLQTECLSSFFSASVFKYCERKHRRWTQKKSPSMPQCVRQGLEDESRAETCEEVLPFRLLSVAQGKR